MIITLTGIPGAGKTVIGKRLAEVLGYEFLSVGQIRRRMAASKNMTLEEYNKLGETDPSTDLEVDEFQKKLSLEGKNLILDSKLGFYFIPNSIKIFITASQEICAKRIMNDNSSLRVNQEKVNSLSEQISLNIARLESDNFRFKKYYGIDYMNNKNFDLILDTSSGEDVDAHVKKICDFLKDKNN